MEERKNSVQYWDKLHEHYERSNIKMDDWLDRFLPIIGKCSTPVLDLGCGSGNDTLYLINHGKSVISCDQSPNAIKNIRRNFPEVLDAQCFDMLDGMPFADSYFDLVIADLCLHYFREKDTIGVLKDIRRILTENGHLIFRVNSMNDVNHGAGQGLEVEPHLFETEDHRLKRFFTEDDFQRFFTGYDFEYLNEEVMTRYQLEKRLYRGCARKTRDN